MSSFSLIPALLLNTIHHLFIFYQDLIERLDSELSGDFLETVMALFVPPAHYDAWCIKEAIYVSFWRPVCLKIFIENICSQIYMHRVTHNLFYFEFCFFKLTGSWHRWVCPDWNLWNQNAKADTRNQSSVWRWYVCLYLKSCHTYKKN